MRFKKIIKLFKDHSVTVTGMKGTGKDLLFGNVIARRKVSYISNLDYGYKYNLLDFDRCDCGGNTYDNFINGDLNYYSWDYPVGADIYLSDAGVYFPAQYCNELNKKYPYLSTFLALSRQLCGGTKMHSNCQNLNRVYDKIREHSDVYLRCRKCIYIFGIVIQFITYYDKFQSCLDRVQPCRVSTPWLNPVARTQALTYKDNFFNQHGTVKNHILIYFNRSKHDSWLFKKLLERGKKREKK